MSTETEILKQMINSVSDLKETDLKPIEFLDYQESIARIKNILEIDMSNSNAVALFLKTQLKVLEYLNDRHINCLVPWDKRTRLPSHPSMVADAQKYPKFFQCSEVLRSVLDSFLGWSLFAREELLCCCGGSLLKPRQVSFDVMLNHVLRVEWVEDDYFLVVKQLVGIRCNNRGHLKNHYNFGQMSQMLYDLSMIFISETGFNIKSGKINHKFISSQKADQFNLEEFSRRIVSAAVEI